MTRRYFRSVVAALLLCFLSLLSTNSCFAEDSFTINHPNWISTTHDDLADMYLSGTPFLAYCYSSDRINCPSIINPEYLLNECGLSIYACDEGLSTYLYMHSVERPSDNFFESVFLYDGITLHCYLSPDKVANGLAVAYPQIDADKVNYYQAVLKVNKYIYEHYSTHQAILDYYSAGNDIHIQKIFDASYEIVTDANATTDMEKAKAIFDWVVENIRYEESPENIPCALTTYERRSGVCEDYSLLYSALCRASGLTCRSVGGNAYLHYPDLIYANFYSELVDACHDYLNAKYPDSYTLNTQTCKAGMGHAWNEVWIDGRWVIVDCTWGEFDLSLEELSKKRIMYNSRESDMSVNRDLPSEVIVKLTKIDEQDKYAGMHMIAFYDNEGRFLSMQSIQNESLDPLVIKAPEGTYRAKLFTVDELFVPVAEYYLGDTVHLDRLDKSCWHPTPCE